MSKDDVMKIKVDGHPVGTIGLKDVMAQISSDYADGLDEKIKGELKSKEGLVAIEPESGDYFVGKTLGQANEAAFVKYPDYWVYFMRIDDPEAAMPLKTW